MDWNYSFYDIYLFYSLFKMFGIQADGIIELKLGGEPPFEADEWNILNWGDKNRKKFSKEKVLNIARK